jgi:hypothetical protein
MIVLLLASLMLLPFANTAFAQLEVDEEQWLRFPYRVTLSLDVGIGMPFNPSEFSDLWNSSLPATFTVGYVVIPYVEVRGWFTIASWGISGIPAQEAIGTPGVHDVQGGTITTLLYGASAKLIPLPNSRIQPSFEIGGGAFQASGKDLEVGTHHTNSMEDASGPVLQFAVYMEYGVNETWQVYTGFNYYIGFSDTFAPGNLLLSGPTDPQVEGDNLQFGSLVLGITLKI